MKKKEFQPKEERKEIEGKRRTDEKKKGRSFSLKKEYKWKRKKRD